MTGFEPAASSSRTGGPQFAAVLLSTCGGVLNTKAVRFVRPVRCGAVRCGAVRSGAVRRGPARSGGPGFVPFLFPGFMSASEATDVGRMTGAGFLSGPGLRTLPMAATPSCDVLM